MPKSRRKKLKLGSRLDAAAAVKLRKDLLGRRGGEIILDGADVAMLGSLCVQVLIAAANDWRADGRLLKVEKASVAIRDGLKRAGIPQGVITLED